MLVLIFYYHLFLKLYCWKKSFVAWYLLWVKLKQHLKSEQFCQLCHLLFRILKTLQHWYLIQPPHTHSCIYKRYAIAMLTVIWSYFYFSNVLCSSVNNISGLLFSPFFMNIYVYYYICEMLVFFFSCKILL